MLPVFNVSKDWQDTGGGGVDRIGGWQEWGTDRIGDGRLRDWQDWGGWEGGRIGGG